MVHGKANGIELRTGSKHMFLNRIKFHIGKTLKTYNLTIFRVIQFALIYLSTGIDYLFKDMSNNFWQ